MKSPLLQILLLILHHCQNIWLSLTFAPFRICAICTQVGSFQKVKTMVFWSNTYHYSDVIMSAIASGITGASIVCSAVCSGADQQKTSKTRATGFCEGNPLVIGLVTRKMFPFDDFIMQLFYNHIHVLCQQRQNKNCELNHGACHALFLKTKKWL